MTVPAPPFELTERHLDVGTGTLAFSFRLGDDTFTETFTFATSGDAADSRGETTVATPFEPVIDPGHPAVEHLLDVAHLCVGVSYYKLTLPGRIVSHRPLHPATAALVPHLYDHGLRELAVRNGLAVPLDVSIETPTSAPPPDVPPLPFFAPFTRPDDENRAKNANGPGPLVPFGGGKDSTLTLSLFADDDPLAFSIHPTPVQRRAAAAVGVPLLEMHRRLDPLLAVRTAEGGWNGHIPITAINSSISAVTAALTGRRDVVIANERSAEEPTQWVDGVPVNHQYSKTFRFETALAEALEPAGIRYFSAVRRWSELAIAGALARRGTLREAILSCNRAFSLTNPDPDPTWCLDCAKCRFTFLTFAAFLTPDEATAMFGGNLLDDPAQIDGVRALWSDKPFDCVGELAESAITLDHLAHRAGWRRTAVVRALRDDAALVAGASGADLEALLTPAGEDRIPHEYVDRIDGVLQSSAIIVHEP